MASAIAIDFETFYSKKLKYSVSTMIAETYVRHELFHPYLVAACDGKTQWCGDPKEFNWKALEGRIIVSHNKYFDYSVYLEGVRRGWWPLVQFAEWHCTANLTAYLCNRRALDKAVEFLYKVKVDKGARESADNKRWPNDFSEEQRKAMLKYAPGDSYWCQKIWTDFSDQWPELERRLSNQTIAQGMRGVQIDTDLLDTYVVQSHEMKHKTEKLLPWLSDEEKDSWEEFDISPTATKCIAEQCKRMGIPCPPVKAHEGEEAYEEWEATYKKANPWIPALSSWRSVNKLYKSFLLMKSRIRSDGTMPFGLKYFGAHTGRWSGSERINMQNPRKKPVLCNEVGLMETNEARIDAALAQRKKTGAFPEWVKYALDFRALFIPRPGKKMITCDLSQIEPRVLAWLCQNKTLLELISGGMSVYEAFARSQMGYDKPGKMDKDSDYYKMIKIQVLGLGYQAGWEKFITICLESGVDITKDDPEFMNVLTPSGETKQVSGYGKRSREIVAAFRAANPLLTSREEGKEGLWCRLDQGFKRSISGNYVMKLPGGRKMSYRDVKCSAKVVKDENGKPKREIAFTAESDGRRKPFYGGKLTENLVQATARDVFAGHLIELEDSEGITVLFTAHDEAICECDPEVTPKDVENIMSRCPDWLPGCPIAAEAKEVAHYTK